MNISNVVSFICIKEEKKLVYPDAIMEETHILSYDEDTPLEMEDIYYDVSFVFFPNSDLVKLFISPAFDSKPGIKFEIHFF